MNKENEKIDKIADIMVSIMKEKYKMNKNKIRVFEMFSGIGGASFGLKKAKVNHKVIGFSDIDKFTEKVWRANHGATVGNYGDCTKIDPNELPDFDLLTGGFPCVAFSNIGKGLGYEDPRGKLFDDIVRIAKVKQPKFMLLENVKGLLNKKHQSFFEYTKKELARIGYNFDIRLYKSSDYGIPQMRERVYYVCWRKDVDFSYQPPEKTELVLKAKDFIENLPRDSIYYRSEKFVKYWKGRLKENGGNGWSKPLNLYFERDIPTITASKSYFDNHLIEQNGWYRYMSPNEAQKFQGLIFDDDIDWAGVSDTQKWKMIGNAWDVNLARKIFEKMFK